MGVLVGTLAFVCFCFTSFFGLAFRFLLVSDSDVGGAAHSWEFVRISLGFACHIFWNYSGYCGDGDKLGFVGGYGGSVGLFGNLFWCLQGFD